MGSDKALLPAADGNPLWARQHAVLAAAGAAEIFLSARPEQAWAREAARGRFAEIVHDAFAAGGPLVGVTAGLERATHGHLAVLAVDLPALEAPWFADLLGRCAPGVGAVGRRDGFFEPLAAIYPREFKWLAWPALARGRFALQPLLAEAVAAGLMRVREIPAGAVAQFANWNEPAAP